MTSLSLNTPLPCARRWMALALALFVAAAMSACAPVQLVADYDSAAFEEILAVSKKVDKFYGTLLEADKAKRPYSAYADSYVALESDIAGMVTRNQARALNSESIQITKLIQAKLDKYKDRHKQRNGYSDGNAKHDRGWFRRVFASAASAEEAKKLSADDKDVDGGPDHKD